MTPRARHLAAQDGLGIWAAADIAVTQHDEAIRRGRAHSPSGGAPPQGVEDSVRSVSDRSG